MVFTAHCGAVEGGACGVLMHMKSEELMEQIGTVCQVMSQYVNDNKWHKVNDVICSQFLW